MRETYHDILLKYFATSVLSKKKIVAYHRRFPTPAPRATNTNQACETTRIPFRTFASRTLSIKCQPCGRCGRYNVARLIARGVLLPMPRTRTRFSAKVKVALFLATPSLSR